MENQTVLLKSHAEEGTKGIVQLFVWIYKSEQCSDFSGWVGLRKLDFRILVREIIRTPRNPIIIVRCTDFLGGECLDLRIGG